MTVRLADDHANARLLAESIAEARNAEIDLDTVETNIVIFRLRDGDAAKFCDGLKQKGVLASEIGADAVRFVTHYDVDREACERAAALVSEQLRAL